jgi:hypothetical protein
MKQLQLATAHGRRFRDISVYFGAILERSQTVTFRLLHMQAVRASSYVNH